MRSSFKVALSVFVFLTFGGVAGAQDQGVAYHIPPARVARGLKALVARDGNTAHNHFCLFGKKGAGFNWTYIFWRERNELVTWNPPYSLAEMNARSILDLKKDVVPTDADIGSSTVLVSRPWVEALRIDCSRVGALVVIDR